MTDWDKLSPLEKHAAIKRMTDEEFAAAMKNHAYRTKTDATPPKVKLADMTDDEFNAAVRNRAWRYQK